MRIAGTWLIFFASIAHASTWYVAPRGDDAGAGTQEHPFVTVQRAQRAAKPGDTVLIHGGTYVMTAAQIALQRDIWAYVTLLDKSGEPGRPILYAAYPGEQPVFDFSRVKPEGLRVHAFHVTASWVHLRGIEVTGVQVTAKQHTQSVGFANEGSHNVYERLSIHDGQAIGIYSVHGANNLFLNCDAYRNRDFTSEDGRGGNTDGFGCHPPAGGTNNVFRGCRAWFNSDDGFDCINAHEGVTFENCWSFYNGFTPSFEPLADGNGFKAGGYGSTAAARVPQPPPRHTVRFCLAVRNKSNGFYANHHPGGSDWLDNTAYRNACDFNLLGRLADNRTDVPGVGHKLRNNLGYHGRHEIDHFDAAKNDASHNNFDENKTLRDEDFVNLDESQLTAPRQPDGSLPAMTFLHPAAGGRLIDRGIDAGFPFRGAAPELGAFER